MTRLALADVPAVDLTRLRQWWCGAFRGHADTLQVEPARIYLRCASCAWTSPGWVLTTAHVVRLKEGGMSMREFFIVAHSFAAPFVSDESTDFASGITPGDALVRFASNYRHPAGLYSATAYRSADAYHKGETRLAQWLCNHEQAKQRLTSGMAGYSFLSHGPGSFEINGKAQTCEDPKAGSVVSL